MTQRVIISERAVGVDAPAYLVAEIGQAHDGSLGIAHSFIDALAEAGADAIKFQTHLAGAESTRDEPFRVRFSSQDDSRFEYWQRMQFTEEQWAGLAEHARSRGLAFLSSAFSLEALELLDRIGVPAWKVGSGEFRSWDLIDAMARSGKPVILSTGMSTYEEIEVAVNRIRSHGARVVALQCTSKYPVTLDEVGLNVIDELGRRLDCPVGLSDHSGSIFPALAAMARGASFVEVHVVFDRRMFGPDASASVTVDEFGVLARARDAFWELARNPVDKDVMARDLEPVRQLFTKSVATVRDLPAGTILTAEMLTTKKPGTGIPASQIEELVGRELRRDVRGDRLLRAEDLHE